MTGEAQDHEMVELTTDIVRAYVAGNKVPSGELADIITSVHAALKGLGDTKQVEAEKPVPPVPVKKTVTPDYLISLEDGRRYKSLKRHLSGRDLTPATYREKWGLPHDYPMVAPNYAKQRSELAKSLGLGLQRRKTTTATAESAPAKAASGTKGRGRPAKAAG